MEALKKVWSGIKWTFENKAVVLWILSLLGLAYQQLVIGEKQQEVVDTQEQVTNVANHMYQHEEVKHPPVTLAPACNCKPYINEHMKRYHR